MTAKSIRRKSLSFAGPLIGAVLASSCAHKPPPTPEQEAQTQLKEYRSWIHTVVGDSERADKLSVLAGDFQTLILARSIAVKEYRSKLATMTSNYFTTRADFDALIAQDDRARMAFLQKLLALRTQMASLTTDEEWYQLKSARMRGIQDAIEGTP